MSIRSKEDAQFLWDRVMESRRWREKQRLKPVLTRLWDGDFNLRGVVAGERKGEFEFIDNDTGTASLQLSLDHYLAKWVMDFRGRAKRNVHVTFDKQGARWSGRMESYRVVREESGDCYLEITFLHDIEELKHMYCWVCPPLLAGRGVGLAGYLSKSILKTRISISKDVGHLRTREVVLAGHVVRQPIPVGDVVAHAA